MLQCEHPDTSDEGFGCNLFPETGCKSIKGERHVKCPGTLFSAVVRFAALT